MFKRFFAVLHKVVCRITSFYRIFYFKWILINCDITYTGLTFWFVENCIILTPMKRDAEVGRNIIF